MVHDIVTAYSAYWAAKSPREEQAAYHEILLFGGYDGFPPPSKARTWAARKLRKLALIIEGRS